MEQEIVERTGIPKIMLNVNFLKLINNGNSKDFYHNRGDESFELSQEFVAIGI